MNLNELKQIQLYRQHITYPSDKITVVKDLCGVQCQILNNAYHSLRIRCANDLNPDSWGDGLVKNWSLRGTVHVFAEEDLPLFKYDDGLFRSEQWPGVTDRGRPWVSAQRERFFAEYIVQCVESGKETRDDIRNACRAEGMTPIEESFIFDGWGGLLRPLCERGFLTYKVQEKKAFTAAPAYVPMPKTEALAEQMRRYLTHIAPATLRDIAYFFGYSQTHVKQILHTLPVQSFSLDGAEYFYMGDLNENYPPVPDCVFLAGFDQLMLGYEKKDSRYFPQEYLRGIFNLAGIVMPGLLLNGNIAGRWKRKNKKLEITCFRTVSAAERKAIEDKAQSIWRNDLKSIQYLTL